MATTTIRISQEARSTLRQLAEESGLSIQTVIDHALDAYRREHFFASLDATYDRSGTIRRLVRKNWRSARFLRGPWPTIWSSGNDERRARRNLGG